MKISKTLAELISDIEVIETSGDLNTVIHGISMDSRKIEQGDLYACVPGFKVDGHDFAESAVAAGASALIVERFLPIDVPQIRVAGMRHALGPVAAKIYDDPSRSLEVVGVTGTNGKTTITHLIEKIGTKQGLKVGLIGTLGARIAGREIPGERTTPEAIEMQKLLKEMFDAGVSLAVMEVSSHALDLGRVKGIEFDAGIFSNLTQDHLDYHKSMEEYLMAKAKLFKSLTGTKQPKIAVLNADDAAFMDLRQSSAVPAVSYGIKNPADYRAYEVEAGAQGVKFAVQFRGKRQTVSYRTPGFFSVYNALAAFVWGVERGYAPEMVAEALAEIPGIPGRFESISLGQPFQVIVDYAHTPDGLENVLNTAREFTTGRLITVFGCGGDRDKAKRPIMGRVSSELSDFSVVTSDNPRTEDPEQIIREILTGIKGDRYIVQSERRQAIIEACRQARPGDTVLIAGKGHETYQIIGTAVNPFDDREEARQALRGLGYVSMDK